MYRLVAIAKRSARSSHAVMSDSAADSRTPAHARSRMRDPRRVVRSLPLGWPARGNGAAFQGSPLLRLRSRAPSAGSRGRGRLRRAGAAFRRLRAEPRGSRAASRCPRGWRGATVSSSAWRNASSAPCQFFWWTRRTSPRRARTSTRNAGSSEKREIDVEGVGQISVSFGRLVEVLERGEHDPLGAELFEQRAEGEDGFGLVVELVGQRLGDLES